MLTNIFGHKGLSKTTAGRHYIGRTTVMADLSHLMTFLLALLLFPRSIINFLPQLISQHGCTFDNLQFYIIYEQTPPCDEEHVICLNKH